MKKRTIISVAAATMISCPAFATGIGASAQSADCDNGVLGTYTGPAALSANWTANTIKLDFYDGEDKISSGQCTYDAGITLPNDPTKTGYEFSGWRVRRAASNNVPCADFDFTLGLTAKGHHFRYNEHCSIYNNAKGTTTVVDCSDSRVSDLNLGDSKIWLSDGTEVIVASKCSSSSVGYLEQGTPSDASGNSCWCKITKINNKEQSLPWVYFSSNTFNNCPLHCQSFCTGMQVAERGAMCGFRQYVNDCTTLTDKKTCISSYRDSEFGESDQYECIWSNSACYNHKVTSCETITEENRCEGSREDYYNACEWDGESCYTYFDD